MRDAFGGAFMIRVFLIFILVYILLTAVVLNYAKAYRAKNLVIDYLEDNEIYDLKNMPAKPDKEAMENYFQSVLVGKLGYVTPISPTECKSNEWEEVYCFEPGVKIKRIANSSSNKLGVYYEVTTYYQYDIGFLKLFKAANNSDPDTTSNLGKWEISGETRPIVRN